MSIRADSIWAASPSTTRALPTIISASSKGERIAYASNKTIFLRSIDFPEQATEYTAHTTTTTVARFSPSGYYVASGDVSGCVRVWDCVGEGGTRGEYHIINGRINDISWDGDSQRIIAVGDGKERFGHCITSDSGNTVGEITGHSALINSVSIRQQRPLRAATGSDDTSLVFYHGAPFKFDNILRGHHTRYVYGVAFSPDGSSLVSVGADKAIWLYDGKTGEAKNQIGKDGHKGSIFGVSWAKDSQRFATCSADQTVKIWDVETGKQTQSWRMGDEGSVSVSDHQVGVVWPAGRSDGLIISLSLAGDLNYLVEGSPKPQKVIQGHEKNITSVALSGHPSKGAETLWTGSSDGRICCWDVKSGLGERMEDGTHTNFVAAIDASAGARIYSVGWDDTLRSLDAQTSTFIGGAVKTDGQPKGLAVIDGRAVVTTHKGIEIFKEGKKTGGIATNFSPTTIAACSGTIATGSDDNKLRIYSFSSDSLTLIHEIDEAGPLITCLVFSPDRSLLAAGFTNGKITVYECKTWAVAISRWSSHSGRVNQIAWNESGTHAVSCSLDTNIFVWSVAKPGTRVNVSNAHKDGVNGVAWLQDGRIASVGGDAAVKIWKVDGLQ